MIVEMIETSAFHMLRMLSQKYPVVLISGPPGCNVASIAKRLMPQKSFVDLENSQIFRLAKESPRTFLMAFPEGVIINAIERLPSMMDAVIYHVVKWGFTPGKYLVVSRSDTDFQDLDGRIAKLDVAGLSIEDLARLRYPLNNPFQVLFQGQLPQILDGTLKMDDLIGLVFRKSILRHINVSNSGLFLTFMKACASCSAQDFSLNMIAKQTGISAPTAKTWLSVLERGYIVRTLSTHDSDRKAFFLYDTGLLCNLLGIGSKEELILSPHKERVMKTFAVNELLRGRFAKAMNRSLDLGTACDLEASWKENFSIVLEPNIEVTEARMEKAKALAGRAKPLILYLGDGTYSRDGIDCIGYRDWSKLAMEIDYFS